MKNIFLLAALYTSLAFAETEYFPNNIEHQIRLCDSNENIISKFNLGKNSLTEIQSKKFRIYYAETRNLDYRNLKWSIRFREKNSKVEITVKKRMSATEDVPNYSNVVCENDLHGEVKEFSCKINSEIPISEFKKVLENHKNWTNVLSKDQFDFLKVNNAIFESASIHGTLEADRFQWLDTNFGLVTVDLVHLNNNSTATFNEVSIRYPLGSSPSLSKAFERYVSSTGVIECANQIDWSVDKFDVLEILN